MLYKEVKKKILESKTEKELITVRNEIDLFINEQKKNSLVPLDIIDMERSLYVLHGIQILKVLKGD